MKLKILEMLKQTALDYVSGEEISARFQVSRTAIWKHIQALREDGYQIESQPRLGYRLIGVPDRLYAQEVKRGLRTEVLGQEIVHSDSVGSTNNLAKELADQGAVEGTLVIAEEQTHGRGRLGRDWVSPKGVGLWSSLILRPPVNPKEAPKLTLLASLAVVKAVRRLCQLEATIKWPNDIIYQGKKISGILTEMSGELDRIRYLVVGIGINVNTREEDFPPELKAIATSLLMETGQEVSRLSLLQEMLYQFELLYQEFLAGKSIAMLEEWKSYCSTLGSLVKVSGLKESMEGIALDISSDGALLLQQTDGTLNYVVAGDVTPQ